MKSLLCFLPVIAVLMSVTAVAQRPPDGGTREVLISILIPSIPNAPFTATVNTEWVRMLADGTTIRTVNHRLVARDKVGRIFQERRGLVPPSHETESPLTQTEISDPVAHQLYICRPQEHVCQLEDFSAIEGATFNPHLAVPQFTGEGNVEDLGTQNVGGLQTIGRRKTITIPEDTIGNDRPLTATQEYWYAEDLGVNLISKRQDPRFGTQTFELSDITVGDPDPKFFEIPPGTKVIDLRGTKDAVGAASSSSN